MKKKLFSLLIILSLFTIIGCTDDEKEDIVAPTIESVYQDVDGAVYLKCTTTHTTYSPDVYFGDSNTSHQTQRTDGDVLILRYSENDGFQYQEFTSTSSHVFAEGDTIRIRIKEQETESTNESDYSNEVSYTLKVPQSLDLESSLIDYRESLHGAQSITSGTTEVYPTPNSKYGIAYDTTESKYVFAENTYTNITQTEDGYTYDDTLFKNDTIAQAYEYHILTQAEISSLPSVYQLTDEFIEQLTFTSCTNITISEDMFVDDQNALPIPGTQTTDKVCYMVYRLKETSTKLASICNLVNIYKISNE